MRDTIERVYEKVRKHANYSNEQIVEQIHGFKMLLSAKKDALKQYFSSKNESLVP